MHSPLLWVPAITGKATSIWGGGGGWARTQMVHDAAFNKVLFPICSPSVSAYEGFPTQGRCATIALVQPQGVHCAAHDKARSINDANKCGAAEIVSTKPPVLSWVLATSSRTGCLSPRILWMIALCQRIWIGVELMGLHSVGAQV